MNKIEESYYGGSEVGRILNEVPVLPDYRIFSVDELLKICTQKEVKEVLSMYKKVFEHFGNNNIINNALVVIKVPDFAHIQLDYTHVFKKVYKKLLSLNGINEVIKKFIDIDDFVTSTFDTLMKSEAFADYDLKNPGSLQMIVLSHGSSNLNASHEFNHVIQEMKKQIVIEFISKILGYNLNAIYDWVRLTDFMKDVQDLKSEAGKIMGDDGSLFMEYAEWLYNDLSRIDNPNDLFVKECIDTGIFDKYILGGRTKQVLKGKDITKWCEYVYTNEENEAWIRNGAIQFLNIFAINILDMNARDFRIEFLEALEKDVEELKKGNFPENMYLENIIDRNFYSWDIYSVKEYIFKKINIKSAIDFKIMFVNMLFFAISCIHGKMWKYIKDRVIAGQ